MLNKAYVAGVIVSLMLTGFASAGTSYVYRSNALIAKINDSGTFYYHLDNLGSTSAVTNEAGEVVEEQVNLPFGQPLIGEEKQGFTGKEFDPDLNLNYFGARYYSPSTGRFLRVDPARDGFNLYSYANNNPLKFTDPSGLEAHSVDDDKTMHFHWTAASDSVDHYKAYVSIDGSDYFMVGTTSTAPTKENPYALGLVADDNKKYRVKVAAADAAGNVGSMSDASDLVWCKLRSPGDEQKPKTIIGAANGDGQVNAQDFSLILSALFTQRGDEGFDYRADLNYDDFVKTSDFRVLKSSWLKRLAPQWLQEILFLPESNDLLQNFPNPSNSGTWIPYQLAAESDVTLRIHDVGGQTIRTISLGRMQTGYYKSKSKAIHWDGRNNVGEKVASGVYFYSMQFEESEVMVGKMYLVK